VRRGPGCGIVSKRIFHLAHGHLAYGAKLGRPAGQFRGDRES
jgi:hypothetical protein